jgi:hypothetical protein
MTRFRSPWQHRWFVHGVALLRRLLRRWPQREHQLIERLVEDQNRRVERHLARTGTRSILLILPRCVKPRSCRCDVRVSLAACAACNECQLAPMARLCEEIGVQALVAHRSHHAFAIARSERPDLIVASACHDRLIKALRSVPEIPALLVPLTGMDRMCVNARFDALWIAERLRRVLPAPRPVGAAQIRAEQAG